MRNSSRGAVAALCAAGLILPAASTGCSSDSTASASESVNAAVPAGPGRVDVAEFASVISRPGIQIIDVRTPAEFASGHIAGAVNIAVQSADFDARIAQLDPTGQYAVYCRSGNRSHSAVDAMKKAGITEIYELETGTNGWTADGQPLVR
jgi:rhodanese-related sulfurtransferase